MLDYYSQYPCPPEDVIIHDILEIVSKKYCLNKKKIENIIKTELISNGGISSMGSFTGYHVFGKKELLNKTLNVLKTYKNITFKNTVKCIMIILKLYKKVRYAKIRK